MRKRGRKSAAELSIVPVAVDGYRPKPPGDLRNPRLKFGRRSFPRCLEAGSPGRTSRC